MNGLGEYCGYRAKIALVSTLSPASRYDGSMANRSSESAAAACDRIHINGEPRDLRLPCSVEGLLVVLNMQNRRVAVAVNRKITPRSDYAKIEIHEGDRIEILEAVGGG